MVGMAVMPHLDSTTLVRVVVEQVLLVEMEVLLLAIRLLQVLVERGQHLLFLVPLQLTLAVAVALHLTQARQEEMEAPAVVVMAEGRPALLLLEQTEQPTLVVVVEAVAITELAQMVAQAS
jgi:hypothetical protein